MLQTLFRWPFFAVLVVTTLSADVVELKTGEHLEGKFKQATAAGVVIEIGGQPINMPLEKVRAIYFGAAPGPQATALRASSGREALQTLKGLQSATTVGVNQRDYATRVADSKVKIDQFIQSTHQQQDAPIRKSIRLAMRYYELAAQAWNSLAVPGTSAMVEVGRTLREDKELGLCSGVKDVIASVDSFFQGHPSQLTPESRLAMVGAMVGQKPSILWQCASEKITEAERLVGK